jgi:FkbM family methyltransferase
MRFRNGRVFLKRASRAASRGIGLGEPAVDRGLIFDVGLHTGQDTAYYLHKGYRVVAVDADLRSVERAELTFAGAVADGRLKVLHCAVAAEDGEVDFHLSKDPLWNSAVRHVIDREGLYQATLRVPARRLDNLMREHGVPYYCKIDVEGSDVVCLATLRGLPELPPYLSVETECVGPNGRLTDAEALATLEGMVALGYRRFKLVDQRGLGTLPASGHVYAVRPPLWKRVRRRLGLGNYGPYNYAGWYTARRRALCEVLGYEFTFDSSGPFGEDLAGEWLDHETARRTLLRHRAEYLRLPRADTSALWCDWHATF